MSDSEEMIVLFSSSEVLVAKEKEIESWKSNDVYEEVENVGQDALTVRWVVTEKIKDGQSVVKARLAARCFEENTDYLRKDLPTCSKEAVFLTLAIASSKQWECHTIDVKTAYLQGYKIEREVYLHPPPEYDSGKLWKLKKTVYGLFIYLFFFYECEYRTGTMCPCSSLHPLKKGKEVLRAWYLRVKSELKLKATMSTLDSALLSWLNEGKIESSLSCVSM